jgi:hypothetical protein
MKEMQPMCGIAGKFNINGDEVSENTIGNMTKVIAHRGPMEKEHTETIIWLWDTAAWLFSISLKAAINPC